MLINSSGYFLTHNQVVAGSSPGDLFRINGYNLGNTVLTVPSESYVKQLGYDQYGNRTYMEYGNGTKTTFEYNANTLRLNEVTALTSALNSTGMAQGMISKTFDYTGAGNIIEINNAATHVNFPYNNLGGGYNNLYAYDGLNRLTNATGDWLGATGPENYSVSMTYDNMGGIVQKNQTAGRRLRRSEAIRTLFKEDIIPTTATAYTIGRLRWWS